MSSTEATLLTSLKGKEKDKITNVYLQELLKNVLRVPGFRGVFPCDLMPRLKNEECMIVNTDPHNHPGRHFVVILRRNGAFFYFDSLNSNLGDDFPALEKQLTLKKMFPLLRVLKTPIQAPTSNFCGIFCLDYVLSLYSPFALKKPIHYVTKNLSENDDICVKNVVKRLEI